MPSDTRPTQFGAAPDLVDPELLRQLNSKRDVLVNAYDQIAQALRFAAKACDEFQALIPKDVGIVPNEHHTSGAGHSLHQSRKLKKPQNKDPNAPKRPNTAYILFSNEIRAETKADNPHANQKEIVTLIGQKWKALSREQKKIYEDRYFADKERYDEELRVYRATHGHVESPPSSNEDNGDHNASSSKIVASSTSNVYVSHIAPVGPSINVLPISVPPSETENALFESIVSVYPAGDSSEQNALATALATSVEVISASSNKRASSEIEIDNEAKQNENAPPKRTRAASKKAIEVEQDVFSSLNDRETEQEEIPSKRSRSKRGATKGANGKYLG